MKIEKIKDDAYKVTLASGEVIILDWNELCSIANFVDVEDAKEELNEFFKDADNYRGFASLNRLGVNLEDKVQDPEFVESVAYDLLSVRTNNETSDDIYDAINSALEREASEALEVLAKEGIYDAR